MQNIEKDGNLTGKNRYLEDRHRGFNVQIDISSRRKKRNP
jgi:hypothetical protein